MKKTVIILISIAAAVAVFSACGIVSATEPAHTNSVDPLNPENVPSVFTVTFDSNGGTAVASLTDIDSGETIAEPADPSHTYGSFLGWYADAAFLTAWDFSTDTVTADITLYAQWSFYAVGDTGPAGGIIFYDDTIGFDFDGSSVIEADEKNLFTGKSLDGLRYLEAHVYSWDGGGVDSSITWGYTTTDVSGVESITSGPAALAGSVGMGLSNTNAIYAAGPADTNAAVACHEETHTNGSGTFDEWFLPSAGEILLMGQHVAEIGDLTESGNYWSSTQASSSPSTNAYYMFTGDGGIGDDAKTPTFYVRPIRAF